MKNPYENILGHENLIKDFRKMVTKNHFPHAILFSGIEGIGKKKVGLAFVKDLFTKNLTDDEKTKIFQMIDNNNFPDFIFVNADFEKKRPIISINEIRKMKDKIDKTAFYDGYRVVMIDNAHLMNEMAQNALLKTLEEPSDNILFLLITDKREKLLETILSRCITIYFAPLKDYDVYNILKREYLNINDEKLATTSQLSSGSITRAKLFLEDEYNIRNLSFNFIKNKVHAKDIFDYPDALLEFGNNAFILFFEYILMFLRDLLILKSKGDFNLLYNKDKFDELNAIKTYKDTHTLYKKLILTEEFMKKQLNSNVDLSRNMQNYIIKWKKLP